MSIACVDSAVKSAGDSICVIGRVLFGVRCEFSWDEGIGDYSKDQVIELMEICAKLAKLKLNS